MSAATTTPAVKSTSKGKEHQEYTEPAKKFSGVIKENYLNGVDFSFSILEQGMKAFNTQVDKMFDLEKECVTNVSEFYKDIPLANGNTKKVAGQFNKYIDIQKEQIKSTRSISEKLTKDAHTVTHGNVEKTFGLFGDYLDLFKVN